MIDGGSAEATAWRLYLYKVTPPQPMQTMRLGICLPAIATPSLGISTWHRRRFGIDAMGADL